MHCRPWWTLVLALWLAGCGPGAIPDRNVTLQTFPDLLASYHDYLKLEKAGVGLVRLHLDGVVHTVSMPYYLFLIASGLERQGRPDDAVKVYLRLLTHFSLLGGRNQLGIRADNRLRWLLGDKSWVLPSVELVRRLRAALERKDPEALRRLISPDFGFGVDEADRLAVNYEDGLRIIAQNMQKARNLDLQVLQPADEDTILLKTTGWSGMKDTWYFFLTRPRGAEGWEWNLAFWEEGREPGSANAEP